MENLVIKQLFTEDECEEIYEYLKNKNFEYHKPYTRYNKIVKVPRGQASYTIDDTIHYNYGKIAGGSPINEVMDDKMKEITNHVNTILNKNYNTILMNVYKDGKDSIGPHQDNENGWKEGTGFATLAFGNERYFVIEEITTKIKNKILHENGMIIEMNDPMNKLYTHSVPPVSSKNMTNWRISLTFREIITKKIII
jgi:alkylated DNA repair dioxygenase AlkB